MEENFDFIDKTLIEIKSENNFFFFFLLKNDKLWLKYPTELKKKKII